MIAINVSPDVLNPGLYKALIDRFGSVRVTNPGIPMKFDTVLDILNPSQKRTNIETWGETYRVCCPKCGDRRFRLLINHRYGTVDKESGIWFSNNVIKCFNENCDLFNFMDHLKHYISKYDTKIIPIGSNALDMTAAAPPPGDCIPLRSLQKDGEVHSYLRSRKGGGFDPLELENKYHVCYCTKGSTDYPMMTGRIVLPIYYHKVLVGWQGRVPGEVVQPKYYTMPGFPKSRVLYNLDKARQKPLVIVCEGIFDVFRVGDPGVCIFGHAPSQFQQQLLFNYCGHGAIAVMFDSDDPDAQKTAQEFIREIRSKEAFVGGAANIVLPGCDPADMTRKQLWGEITRQLSEQGVRVSL